jgi:transcriptional regulator with XRE-family HTH domain
MGNFCDNLRILRLRRLMSQETLAKRIGVSQNLISLYEKGEASPKLAIAMRLAKALGVTIEQLVGEDPPNTSA